MTAAARPQEDEPPKRVAPVRQTNRNYKASRRTRDDERPRRQHAETLSLTLALVERALSEGERRSEFMKSAGGSCPACGHRAPTNLGHAWDVLTRMPVCQLPPSTWSGRA